MSKFFTIIIIISFFLLSFVKAETLQKFEISGNKRISDQTIIIFSEVKVNEEITKNKLDEIIKNNDENFDNLSEEDEALITKSIDLIRSTNKASTSFLQRNFQVGYNKAARIMEALEQRGVVSPPNHAGKRDILINQ